MNHRNGLTLLELLVSIAIIGVLVTLLLPAVQAAREAARQVTCKSNLRQLGFACQNYNIAFNAFPPERLTSPETNWAIFILPHIEQFSLAYQYDRNASWKHPTNQNVVQTQLAIMQCPSTPDSGQRWDRLQSSFRAAAGDYGPTTFVNSHLVAAGYIEHRSSLRGLFLVNHGSRSSDVLDGLSNTILFSEDAGRPHFFVGRRHGPANNAPGGAHTQVVEGRVPGAGWADPGNGFPLGGFSRDGLSTPGPCPINCTNNNEAYSFHIGGVNIALADGSTRYLSDAVTIEVFASLITAQGGETVTLE